METLLEQSAEQISKIDYMEANIYQLEENLKNM
jgi:hypothetical protein